MIGYLSDLNSKRLELDELESLILLSVDGLLLPNSAGDIRLLSLANKYLKEAPLKNPEEKSLDVNTDQF